MPVAGDFETLPRTSTREIKPTDRGRRTEALDLALAFDPATRTYARIAASTAR